MPGSERGGGASGDADQVHQPGARPQRGGVEAALGRLLAVLAVGRHRRVDEPPVERREVLPADAQALARVQRRVGHEHVGAGDEPAQHVAPGGLAQVEGETALAPVVDDPAIVVRALGHAGPTGAMTVEVAVRRLDLDDVGAQVREHGRGDRARDEARGVDDAQTVEQAHGIPGRSTRA
jgi:hypothetical protein